MEKLALTYFPFPHKVDGERREGQEFNAPSQCGRCDRQCERNKTLELKLCSYGVNYIGLDSQILVFGFLLPPVASAAHKKAIRNNPQNVVTPAELGRAIETYRSLKRGFESDVEKRN
jgi:hypothetical protein